MSRSGLLDDSSIRAKAKEWGLSKKSAHRILRCGLSIEGKMIMIEQAQRCAANRRRNAKALAENPH